MSPVALLFQLTAGQWVGINSDTAGPGNSLCVITNDFLQIVAANAFVVVFAASHTFRFCRPPFALHLVFSAFRTLTQFVSALAPYCSITPKGTYMPCSWVSLILRLSSHLYEHVLTTAWRILRCFTTLWDLVSAQCYPWALERSWGRRGLPSGAQLRLKSTQ